MAGTSVPHPGRAEGHGRSSVGRAEQGTAFTHIVSRFPLIDDPVKVVAAKQDGDRCVQADGIYLGYGVKGKLGVHGNPYPFPRQGEIPCPVVV